MPAPAQTASSARRRVSQAELDLLIDAHERLLGGRPAGRRLTLKFADLSGLHLEGRNLSDADLSGSTFDGCKMAHARFERSILFGCDLRKADLRHAVLTRADLRGACLRGANLAQADLTQADFREGTIGIPHPTEGLSIMTHQKRSGDLDNAILSGARLDGSQLHNASAHRADFTDCSLKGAILSGANLKDADMSGASLEGAEVGGANLENAKLKGADLTGVDFQRCRSVVGCDMSGALKKPSAEAFAKAEELLGRARDNHAWRLTGGKSGKPANFDGGQLHALQRMPKGT
jgi:uncharacterized protein YjbI with pentapeptide repeats